MMTIERRKALLARLERVTERPMLVLALAFVATMVIPEVFDLSDQASAAVEVAELGICALFAIELAAKTYLALDRLRYLTSHWFDVIAVALPFLRPLRLLRVAMMSARLLRQTRTYLRRRTSSLIGVTGLTAVSTSALLVYAAERGGDGPIRTIPDAFWWASATITTVGYGDLYPTTTAGRAVAIVLMLVGVGLFGLLTARVATFLVEDDQDRHAAKLEEILVRLRSIEEQRVVSRGESEVPRRDG
jgi:voltage-gated potassium channel